MLDRRHFLGALGAGLAGAALTPLRAQQQEPTTGAANVPMEQDAYKPVRLAPKSSTPSMTDMARDDLEHRLHCQCGCNLDIFTCRTTDFSCAVSPAMHHDVQALVAGGYGASEIIAAFTEVYGERVLMEPVKQGFNWAGYLAPFAAIGGGAALIVVLLRRWRGAGGPTTPASPLPVTATPEELQRLSAAMRNDDP